MPLSDFDDVAWHVRRLRRARRSGRLTLVLGAGINSEYGLPDWSNLLVDLLLESGRIRKAKNAGRTAVRAILDEVIRDPLLQAVAVRFAFARNDQRVARLRNRLSRYDRRAVESPKNPIGKAASLIAGQYLADRHRHIAVITFNYDDLLEVALTAALPDDAREAVRSVSTEEVFFSSIHAAGIFIYHLHGYIDHKENDFVLDAASYVSILASPGRHWSWHCMNNYLFQEDGACLFLGLSLVDPSLRLLITQSAIRGLSLSAIYVSKPFPNLKKRTANQLRNEAFVAHDIVQLYDGVLRDLSLVPYHLKSWRELPAFLDTIAEDSE